MAKSRIWNFFDRLNSDKVVWMIVLLLILISAVTIFSSTSQLADAEHTRVDIISDQLKVTVLGIILIIGCYLIKNIKVYRTLAQLGFIASLGMLIIVDAHIGSGASIGAGQINGAWRVIRVKSFQLHIYEVIKVAMVMYLAWAVDCFNKHKFKALNELSKINHLHWLQKPFVQKCIYIYIPILVVMGGIIPGSGSSSLFIGLVMLATVLIGGLRMKEVLVPVFILLLLGSGLLIADKASHGEFLKDSRIGTWTSRLKGSDEHVKLFLEAPYKSQKYFDELDKIRQPYSAKIAIHEGGLIGKGPGQSTQRYVVPVMYEDYMFSFIIEEYGLLGGIFVIILYLSLLARASLIVRNCSDPFGKITVAGLAIMISGQAFMHMLINSGIGPLTGQTLPLISHGKTSFLVFCIAFGIILSISRMASRKIEKETREAEPLMERKPEVQASLEDLDALEDSLIENNMENYEL